MHEAKNYIKVSSAYALFQVQIKLLSSLTMALVPIIYWKSQLSHNFYKELFYNLLRRNN